MKLTQKQKMEQIGKEIEKFSKKWKINIAWVDYEVTKDGAVIISVDEAGISKEAVYRIAEVYPNLFSKDRIEKEITWYEKMVAYDFYLVVKVENNNAYVRLENNWKRSEHLNSHQLETRYKLIEKITEQEFQESVTEGKMKLLFLQTEKHRIIDEMMKKLEHNGYFSMKWTENIREIYEEDIKKLKEEIEKYII